MLGTARTSGSTIATRSTASSSKRPSPPCGAQAASGCSASKRPPTALTNVPTNTRPSTVLVLKTVWHTHSSSYGNSSTTLCRQPLSSVPMPAFHLPTSPRCKTASTTSTKASPPKPTTAGGARRPLPTALSSCANGNTAPTLPDRTATDTCRTSCASIPTVR